MRVLVLVAMLGAAGVVLAGLQGLVNLARRLPPEPRSRRARPVLGSSVSAGRGTGSARRPSLRPMRGSGRTVGGPGLNDLRQLESLCQRALLGEPSAIDRLAGRVGTAAEACGLPPRSVPAAAHRSMPELLSALDGVERESRA
jgi:hypothetical protein